MQIPWLFPIFIFSLTFNKIPWLFPDSCQVWKFPDFSLTAGHPEVANTSKIDKFEWFIARQLEMAPSDCNHF